MIKNNQFFTTRYLLFIVLTLFMFLDVSGQESLSCKSKDLDTFYSQAATHLENTDYELSIASSLKVIDLAKKRNCYDYLFKSYNLLSVSYLDLKDTVPSLLYSNQALHYAKESNNDTLLVYAYNNLGSLYSGDSSTWNKAMKLYEKSHELEKTIEDGSFYNAALNLAELHRDMGDYDAMPAFLNEATSSLNEDNISFNDPRIYLNILWGDYYYEKDDKSRALSYYTDAFKGTEKDSLGFLALDFYPRYVERLQRAQQYKSALRAKDRLHYYEMEAVNRENKESLLLAKATAEIQEYKTQRNEAKLQQQLADQDLKRKNTIEILLAILTVILLVFAVNLIIHKKRRKKLIVELRKRNVALKKAKQSAEDNIAAKEKFFSTLSHEMRTPLYGVTGIVSLLEKSNSIKAHKEELSSLKFSAGHLLDIINDLLDISKLENETFELRNRPFNLRSLTREIVSSVDQYAMEQRSTVHLELSPHLPNYVIGDSRRLSQVLLNILSNSMKFTTNGDIWIKVNSEKADDGHYDISFSIEDNGKGMTEKSQKLMFKEFGQIGDGVEKNHIGTGLGMPIVKKILEKMKSSIHVESEKGIGSLFQFSIGFEEATLLDVIKFSSSNNSQENKKEIVKGATFLIVDDNKINRMVTSKILTERGATTVEAAGGKEALEIVKYKSFDIILMDINMPGMNGFETTQALRENGIKNPIIALTAAEASYMDKMIKTYGMNGAIIKPYSMDEFLTILSQHLPAESKTITM